MSFLPAVSEQAPGLVHGAPILAVDVSGAKVAGIGTQHGLYWNRVPTLPIDVLKQGSNFANRNRVPTCQIIVRRRVHENYGIYSA